MTNLEIVKSRLYEKNASLVVMFENGKIEEYYNPRVQDIVSILKENEEALKGTIIADKVIKKEGNGMCQMENKFKDEKDLINIYNYFIK